jgi:hypothetical protein
MRGKLDSPCNAVGHIDRVVLGIEHMYQRPAWKRSKVCSLFLFYSLSYYEFEIASLKTVAFLNI